MTPTTPQISEREIEAAAKVIFDNIEDAGVEMMGPVQLKSFARVTAEEALSAASLVRSNDGSNAEASTSQCHAQQAPGLEEGSEESLGEVLERLGMNGELWALEFKKTAIKIGYSDMDEGWLLTWFCNAIMAGYDRGVSEPQSRSQQAGEQGWQPIETAPKDGKPFIAFVPKEWPSGRGTVRIVQWGKTSHVPLYGFCLADQGAEEFDLCDPTHWQPLPAAPQSKGDAGYTDSADD